MEKIRIRLTVNGNSFSAVLEPGQTAEALRARLERGDIKIRMEDYGNMEKVGGLGFSLPRHDVRTVTGPGDMVLYQGNSLVIFYGTNTWGAIRLWARSKGFRHVNGCWSSGARATMLR